MSVQITPRELAEIVTGLLLKPSLLGELDLRDSHEAFFQDIGKVVAAYCGGDAASILNHDGKGDIYQHDYMHILDNEHTQPYLTVHPNDSLPTLHNNIWCHFDPLGWEDEDAEDYDLEPGKPISAEHIVSTRAALQSLLVKPVAQDEQTKTLKWSMQDWIIADNVQDVAQADQCQYDVSCTIGNQTMFSISSDNDDNVLDILIEINEGVPAVHFMINEDGVLHVHSVDGGLVLAPDTPKQFNNTSAFENAPINRYSYFENDALLIRNK